MGTESDYIRYCPVCDKETIWEDGFNIETGEFSEWCTECETAPEGVE